MFGTYTTKLNKRIKELEEELSANKSENRLSYEEYIKDKQQFDTSLAETAKRLSNLQIIKDEAEAKHKRVVEDIKHLIKINEERNTIELEKAKLDMTIEKNDAIAKVKDEYQTKLVEALDKRGDEMKEIYMQITNKLS